jgi:small RNA 2'-O-methyltransferase
LDVGCGEGILLQHLTHAPPWRAYTSSTPAPAVFEKPDFIHSRELHGLDILHSDLLYAADITAPSKHAYGWTRFEQLDVSMWEGSLQAPNPAFKGIECIIATEVYATLLPHILYWLTSKSSIEHLPEEVVDTFAPVLLGNYAPRLLLFTTPCFDFNERFSAPGDDMWGFADPTGRTNRIFRHSDHKFEWTVDECVQWSKAAAEEWGYDVVIDGVGRSTTKDPWGRDSTNIYASQAVTFRRREDEESTTKRAQKYAEWASRRAEETQSHKLLVTHRYEAHVGAQKPAPREEIAAAVKSTIQEIASSEVTIFEIWREDAVSTVCGGWLEVLLDVLDQDDSFLVHKEGKNADDWKIELPGVELQGKNPWQSPARQDDAWGESSESTESAETYDDEDEYPEYYAEDDEEEYDGDDWDETEDSGWAVSDSEGWSKDESDVNTLKAWGEWRPAPGWIMEGTWD